MLWQGKIFFAGITRLSWLLFWAENKYYALLAKIRYGKSFFIVTKIMLSHII